MVCYLIMIFNEKQLLIHCHSFKGWQKDAEDNAEKSCRFHNGFYWRIAEVTAD